MPTPNTEELITNRFKELRPLYSDYAENIKHLVSELLKAKGIEVLTIESRAKTEDSLRKKVLTKREEADNDPSEKAYDSLEEITDLTGVRVVTFQHIVVKEVSNIIKDNFRIDKENSVNKSEKLKPDQFGYLSEHWVVEHTEKRLDFSEHTRFKGLKAEIQVRTTLQHAWASIEHKLIYKASHDAPKAFRRSLNRLSALLETVDIGFDLVQKEMEDVIHDTEKRVKEKEKESEIPLDIDSLKVYVTGNNAPQYLIKIANNAGTVPLPHPPNSKNREFSRLLAMLKLVSIDSLQQLEELLETSKKDVSAILQEIHTKWQQRVDSPPLALTTETILRVAVLFATPPSDMKTLIHEATFGAKLREAVQCILDNRFPDEKLVLPFK